MNNNNQNRQSENQQQSQNQQQSGQYRQQSQVQQNTQFQGQQQQPYAQQGQGQQQQPYAQQGQGQQQPYVQQGQPQYQPNPQQFQPNPQQYQPNPQQYQPQPQQQQPWGVNQMPQGYGQGGVNDALRTAQTDATKNKKIAVVATVALCVVVLIGAVVAFMMLRGGGDSAGSTAAVEDSTPISPYIACKKGDYIKFGKYEQDNNPENGAEDIEWLVLDKQEDTALIISKYALANKPYNTEKADVTWETCSLRHWLNNEFVNEAFGKDEAERIQTVTVTADESEEYDTDPGNDTRDKVFVLSYKEKKQYMPVSDMSVCKATPYAEASGAYVNKDSGNCHWWLRTPGFSMNRVESVPPDGNIYNKVAGAVDAEDKAVRPAIWIYTK